MLHMLVLPVKLKLLDRGISWNENWEMDGCKITRWPLKMDWILIAAMSCLVKFVVWNDEADLLLWKSLASLIIDWSPRFPLWRMLISLLLLLLVWDDLMNFFRTVLNQFLALRMVATCNVSLFSFLADQQLCFQAWFKGRNLELCRAHHLFGKSIPNPNGTLVRLERGSMNIYSYQLCPPISVGLNFEAFHPNCQLWGWNRVF